VTRSDRYEFQELLGAGATSRVYRAFDRDTRGCVAVKVLNPHLRTDEVSLERFRRELQITRRINHPQIVSIYDLVSEPERTFLVMELLDGRSLKEFIALEQPVPLVTVLACIRQILDVLAVCHALDVVHRDLKPQNVFIDAKGRIKLLDFGIARMTSLRDMTQTGTSLGSPEYMAPELFAVSTYDPRTDLYAVGVIAFELLAGRLPFQGDTLAILFRAHRETTVPDLRELRPEVPVWLEQIVAKLLAKRSHERYQSAEEALADLDQKRVLSLELPELPQRPCLDCDEATLAELAVCIRCGANRIALSEPGRYDLRCKRGERSDELGKFLAECLDLKVPQLAKRQTLVLRGIRRRSAEILRRQAARRQLYLEVRRSPWTRRWIPTIPVVAAEVCVLSFAVPHACWRIHAWWWPWWRAGHGPDITLLGAMGIKFLLLLVAVFSAIAGPYLAWRTWLGRRPLVPDPGRGMSNRLSNYEWVDRLAPVLARAPAGNRTALSGMIEKYLLLQRRGEHLDPDRNARLQGLLKATASLEALSWEIAEQLDDAELARVTQQYDAVRSSIEREENPARRGELEVRRGELAERLRAFSRMEEMHSSLVNRLTRAQAAFNRLIGTELVLRAPFDDLELEALVESLERAELEAEAHRELEARGSA
jgi:tRNA A-37 threonylcarbamoyl transferase component Bud32